MGFTGPAGAAEDSPGELVFLSISPRARERKPPASAFHAQVLMNAADAIAAELGDDELPKDLREELATQVGELIATAWTPRLPRADVEPPAGLKRLALLARRGPLERRLAEGGLRRVIEVVAQHARTRGLGPHHGYDPSGNAVAWLVRLDHPIAIAALFDVSRTGASPEARAHAADELGRLARLKSPRAFGEACARILLE